MTDDVFETYLDYLAALRKSSMTVSVSRLAMKSFKDAIDACDVPVEPVEAEVIAWIKAMRVKGYKGATIKNYVLFVKLFYGYLKDRGLVSGNIFERFYWELPSGRRQTMRPYKTLEEISRLIRGTFNIRDRGVLVLLAKTGIRAGELTSLNMVDVNMGGGMLVVNKHVDKITGRILCGRKNKEETLIPLDSETIIVLQACIAVRPETSDPALFVSHNGKRLNVRDINKIVYKWVVKTGIHANDGGGIGGNITPHYFRAWFTRMMQKGGCDPEIVEYLRGDKAGSMRSMYSREVLNFGEIKEAYLQFVPKFGI